MESDRPLVTLALVIFLSGCSGTEVSVVPPSPAPETVYKEGDKGIVKQSTWGCIVKEDRKELRSILTQTKGQATHGSCVQLLPNTKVRLITLGAHIGDFQQVEVASGPLTGKFLWTRTDAAIAIHGHVVTPPQEPGWERFLDMLVTDDNLLGIPLP